MSTQFLYWCQGKKHHLSPHRFRAMHPRPANSRTAASIVLPSRLTSQSRRWMLVLALIFGIVACGWVVPLQAQQSKDHSNPKTKHSNNRGNSLKHPSLFSPHRK